ncbi:chorismate mutase [Thermococcus stetteri]|uniref:chorismate mutase n=1 Tax=Thermococcus stetteri TaxID=49900 RepID=UPI003159476C|nr:monofunctional chorismate mutase [Thermococcus stetteri]
MNVSKSLSAGRGEIGGDGDVPPILDPVNEELALLRRRIDEIDEEIISLLYERLEIARKIEEVKLKSGLPIYDPEREEEVLRWTGQFREVFEAILEVSRDVQRLRVLQQDKRSEP